MFLDFRADFTIWVRASFAEISVETKHGVNVLLRLRIVVESCYIFLEIDVSLASVMSNLFVGVFERAWTCRQWAERSSAWLCLCIDEQSLLSEISVKVKTLLYKYPVDFKNSYWWLSQRVTCLWLPVCWWGLRKGLSAQGEWFHCSVLGPCEVWLYVFGEFAWMCVWSSVRLNCVHCGLCEYCWFALAVRMPFIVAWECCALCRRFLCFAHIWVGLGQVVVV